MALQSRHWQGFLYDCEPVRIEVRLLFISTGFFAEYLAYIKDFGNPMPFQNKQETVFGQWREKAVWLSSWSGHIAFINSSVNRLEHSISWLLNILQKFMEKLLRKNKIESLEIWYWSIVHLFQVSINHRQMKLLLWSIQSGSRKRLETHPRRPLK